jgi:single-strand DNA-binding protein
MNLNKAMIIGRITQPLELKTLPNGTAVVNFSVATNYVYKDQSGNKVEQTEFHNIVSFGKQAETIAQYFVKGQEIYCEGRLQTRNWDDKESGKKMYRTEIVLDRFEFGAKPTGADNSNYGAPGAAVAAGAAGAVAGSSIPETADNSADEINYPDEEINPEDIPF